MSIFKSVSILMVFIGGIICFFSLYINSNIKLKKVEKEVSVLKQKNNTEQYVAKKNVKKIESLSDISVPKYNSEYSNSRMKLTNDHKIPKLKSLFEVIENHARVKKIFLTNQEFSQYGEPIRINESNLRSLKPGQILKLPLNGMKEIKVDKIDFRKNGSRRIKLSFPGEDKIYRGFLTVGANNTYGRIITPEGGYELEIVNGEGWIVDTRNIDDRMPANGIDYVVPTIN